jgi:hypothetical protein
LEVTDGITFFGSKYRFSKNDYLIRKRWEGKSWTAQDAVRQWIEFCQKKMTTTQTNQ